MTSKSETQIAQANIEIAKLNMGEDFREDLISETHKATCQRFLEFLEEREKIIGSLDVNLHNKITDLKQAIKLYDDAGI